MKPLNKLKVLENPKESTTKEKNPSLLNSQEDLVQSMLEADEMGNDLISEALQKLKK